MNHKLNDLRSFLVGVIVLVAAGYQPPLSRADTVLVYRVDQPTKDGASIMMSEVIARRLKERGLPESKVEVNKDGRIVVTLKTSDAKVVETQKTLISGPETFEFRILANRLDEAHAQIINLSKDGAEDEVKSGGKVVARWVPFSDPKLGNEAVTRTTKQGVSEALVIYSTSDLDGSCVSSAKQGLDEVGKPLLDFELTKHGAELMGELTSRNLPDPAKGISYQLGLVFDGELKTAAAIRSTITSRGWINGNFTVEEVKSMLDLFGAGSRPLPLTLERQTRAESAEER